MSSDSSSVFECDFGCRKVDLIMEDEDILTLNLIKSRQRSYHIPRIIHKSLRFCKDDFFSCSFSLDDFSLELCYKFPASKLFSLIPAIQKRESDIVSGFFIIFAWIAESDDQFHQSFYSL